MAVSLSGIARFLVRIGASEPNARRILRDVQKAHAKGSIFGSGQMIESQVACRAMGEYGDMYWGWISGQSLEALMDLGAMMHDLHAGNCVATANTVIAFAHQQGMHAKPAVRILRRASWCHADGVITCHSWREFIPKQLTAAWLEYNGLPPEEPGSSEEDLYGPPPSVDTMGDPIDDSATWAPEATEEWFPCSYMNCSMQLASLYTEHAGEDIAQ